MEILSIAAHVATIAVDIGIIVFILRGMRK